jgi:hypothetical protein
MICASFAPHHPEQSLIRLSGFGHSAEKSSYFTSASDDFGEKEI